MRGHGIKSASQLDVRMDGPRLGTAPQVPGFPTLDDIRAVLTAETNRNETAAPTEVLDTLAPSDWLTRAMKRGN